jgi:hypothetical protein
LCDSFTGIFCASTGSRVSKELIDSSQVSSVGLSITEIEATVHGYGNHMDDMTKAQNHEALMVSLIVLYYAIVNRN